MATPHSVAMMLITVLATDNLSEVDGRIEAIANLHPVDPKSGKAIVCSITNEKTLRGALAVMLGDETTAKDFTIELSRKGKSARLIDTADFSVYSPTQFGRRTRFKGVELTAEFRDLGAVSRELKKVST
jgi:hypothetical protein